MPQIIVSKGDIMKKVNVWYVTKWILSLFVIGLILIILGFNLYKYEFVGDTFSMIIIFAGIFAWAAIAFLPRIMENWMGKRALELEKEFYKNKFDYQYKFSSHNGIFYISDGGRLGIIWKCNPFELQFADSSKITNIHVDNGQILFGTSLVSCQFKVEGKKIKIYTLRVRRGGQLSMKDSRVKEAIDKATDLCVMVKKCQQNAVSGKTANGDIPL